MLSPGFLDTREAGLTITWKCFLGCPYPFSQAPTVLDPFFLVRQGVLEKHYVMLRWQWFLSLLTTIRRTSSRLSLSRVWLCDYVLPFEPLLPLRRRFVPCQDAFVNGNPCGSRSKIHSRKLVWKSGSSSAMYFLKDQALHRILWSRTQIKVKSSPRLPRVSKHSNSVPWESAKPQGEFSLVKLRQHCFRPRTKCDSHSSTSVQSFFWAFGTAVSNEVILSGHEELDSLGNDFFASCHEILVC